MSPRAASRLERLGFEVYDYVAGKVDWLASGLPTVRGELGPSRALDQADRAPATCSPDTLVGVLGPGPAIVVDANRVVLGRVASSAERTAGQTAEAAMDPGPTTVRAHEPLDDLLERMAARGVTEIVVTTPEGVLLGVVRRP